MSNLNEIYDYLPEVSELIIGLWRRDPRRSSHGRDRDLVQKVGERNDWLQIKMV